MLLRFGVTNHRSLRDPQEVCLVASPLDDNTTGLIACRHAPGNRLLPTVVVYGPNASGKSNLVSAIQWMRSVVLYSHSYGEPDGGIERMAFALDPTITLAPSHYEIDFIADNVRYHYGFEATNDAFTAEWLFTYPNDRRQALFERDAMQFRFGRNLKGRNQVISELTRPNSLFLSAAAQNGHEELTKISRYFQNMVVDESSHHELTEYLAERSFGNRIIRFLRAAGTGVIDYRLKDVDLSAGSHHVTTNFDSLMSKYLNTPFHRIRSLEQRVDVQLTHQGARDEPVYFELSQESEGTQRLLGLLAPAFRALDIGALMVVDELDASLHTHACELLIALFSSPKTNPKGAQLLATTHDTNLLRSSHLRRDQVWLTEKDSEGATHLYPLTDFRTRKSDNLERGYLQGRYGAIPFSGDPADVLANI
jgi:hypothetical protein